VKSLPTEVPVPTTLGLLLALPPEDSRAARALAFLRAQQQANARPTIYLYCLADGVKALTEPRLQNLRREGVHVLACAQSALQRQISPGDQADFGGLGLLTDLIAGVDIFLSLGPGSPLDWAPTRREFSPAIPPETREVVVTIQDATADLARATEAVRVAAGLRASGPLPVALAGEAAAVQALTELSKTGADPIFSEYMQLFLENGGQIVSPSSSEQAPDSLTQNAFPQPQRLPVPAWEARLAQAFALIPF